MNKTMKKTTINLKPSYQQMLEEIEERFGINQTSVIQFGIILSHKWYFTEHEERNPSKQGERDTLNTEEY